MEGGSINIIPETLEVVHGQGVALNPGTTNELGQHIEGDLDTGHGFGDTNRNDEDDAENEAVEDDAGGCVGLPAGDTGDTEAYGDGEEDKVPPFRNYRLKETVRSRENDAKSDKRASISHEPSLYLRIKRLCTS